jgi:hypothetical protein
MFGRASGVGETPRGAALNRRCFGSASPQRPDDSTIHRKLVRHLGHFV